MSSTEENSNSPATTPQENEPSGEQADPRDLEKIEEEKLKSKYPSGMRVPGGHSAFLQKRLQKGVSLGNIEINLRGGENLIHFPLCSKSFSIQVIIKWPNKKVVVSNRFSPIRWPLARLYQLQKLCLHAKHLLYNHATSSQRQAKLSLIKYLLIPDASPPQQKMLFT